MTHEGWWAHADGTWGWYRFEGGGWVCTWAAASEAAIEAADRRRRWPGAGGKMPVAHIGVDDGTVAMCVATGAPFGPPVRVHYVGWQPPRVSGVVVDGMRGETKPSGYEWCGGCLDRHNRVHGVGVPG